MSSPQVVPVVVVFDYLLDMSGTAIPNARVQCVLDENAATTITPATSIIEKQQVVNTDSNGYFTFSLIPNTNISPANTTYTIITPARTYQITVGSTGPYQTTANGTIVDVPVALNPATTGLTGPITVTGNLTVTGNETISGTLGAGTTALGATTVSTLHATGAATLDSGATVTAGGLTVTAGGATVTAGNVAITAGELTMGAATSKIVPGATSLSLRNNADGADNLLVADAGAVTVRNGLTVTAGNAAITAGELTFGAASSKIVPGATSLSLRNNADGADNLLITNAGAVTVRAGLTVTAGGATVTAGNVTTNGDLILATAPRIKTTGTIPTVGSGGSGVSALSVVTGSTNTAGQVNATLTGVAPGVVIGVVAFGGGAVATAPIAVVASLSAPTAGVAAPPDIGADTFTTSGFTLRSYGPTTVTTGAYVISYIVIF